MKIGDYVKITCWATISFGFIMGFEIWEDEDMSYEMVELLCDNGYPMFLPDDSFEVIDVG